MNPEILRLNISDYEAMQIRHKEVEKGNRVSIFRYSKDLIEITIDHPSTTTKVVSRVIDVTPMAKRLH